MNDAALLSWFSTATLPDTYAIGRHLRIDSGAKSHGWMRERLAEGCKGLMRSGILARLRVLHKMFGDKGL